MFGVGVGNWCLESEWISTRSNGGYNNGLTSMKCFT